MEPFIENYPAAPGEPEEQTMPAAGVAAAEEDLPGEERESLPDHPNAGEQSDAADEQAPDTQGTAPSERHVDYAALAAQDLLEIQRMVPSLRGLSHLGELPNASRYAALRDAGLSVEEAFWAACHTAARTASYDNRSHLHSVVPRGAAGNPAMMSASEMAAAKELFEDLSENEIQRLYAKCRA